MSGITECPTTQYKQDKEHKMKALQWFGTTEVKVNYVPKPLITDPKDAIIRVTSSSICGSDLHFYHNEVKGLSGSAMKAGDILGHECMGIIESVGREVTQFHVGDRVVVSCVIACGNCSYCKNGQFSSCDCTNPSLEMEQIFGQRPSGVFGYSQLSGGYAGGQAEYIRVPIADVNLLKVPPSLTDEQVLLLSDVCCTGYHANELGNVSEGQTVGVWGCGPVGLMALAWAKFRGASRLIAIDAVAHRLRVAERLGAETINFAEKDVIKTIREMVPTGLDVAIDCVGFRFPKSLMHKFQKALKLETSTPEVLNEAILSVRKCGTVSIVGDYFGPANNFPIGAMMEKGLTVRSGGVFVQKYWKYILDLIEKNKFDPTFVFTHELSLDEAEKAYKMIDKMEDGVIKIILKPGVKASV